MTSKPTPSMDFLRGMIFFARTPPRIVGVRLLQWALLIHALFYDTCAQTTSFQFDANGNLTAQFGEIGLKPRIIGHPQTQLAEAGSSARFAVVLGNPGTATFQWRFNNANIEGATGPGLVLTDVSTGNEGDYSVLVTNPSGSVTSESAKLWIDNDGDGMGDSWEISHFGNLSANATRDSDGDGLSNQREFQDGTNPTDPDSARYRLLVVREGGTLIRNPDRVSYDKGQNVTLSITSSGSELFHAWLGDVVSRENPVTVSMNKDTTVFARFTPIRFIWTNALAGAWENPTNWTPQLAPGFADSVVITNGVVVTLSTNATCADVTLGGNTFTTLTGTGDLTVLDNFLWTAGTLGGTGRTILDTNAFLTIRSLVGLERRRLENHGTILWSDGNLWVMMGGAVVSNAPGGLIRYQNPNAVILGGGIASGRFENSGTLELIGGSGPFTVSKGLFFLNAGTLSLSTNVLHFEGGFANDGHVALAPAAVLRMAGGGPSSGSFNATPSSIVEWAGGEYRLSGTAQLDGEGLYRIVNSSTVLVDADVTVSTLELTSGTLGGSGTVVLGRSMHWTAGTLAGPGKTLVPEGSVLNINPVGSIGLNGRRLENAGTIVWKGDRFGMAFNATLTNRPGALVVIDGTGLSSVAGENWVDNAGTIRKKARAGTIEINSIVNNFGTIEVESGNVLWNGAFNNTGTFLQSSGATNEFAGGGSSSGTMNVPSDALVEWTGRTFTLAPGAKLEGDGLYRLNGIGARILGNADVRIDNFDFLNASSTWEGAGLLQIQKAMNWVGGTMEGSGRTLILPGAQLNMGGGSGVSLHRTLENAGSVRWLGNGTWIFLNGVFTNRAGAVFDVQTDSRLFYAGGTARFDNAGTFRKSSTTGVTDFGIPFANQGTVDLRGGILAAKAGFTSTRNATLLTAISGSVPGTGFGQLQVTGPVTVDGQLQLEFLNGFVPEIHSTFTILTASSRAGAFSSFLYPEGTFSMQLTNTLNSVVAQITEPILTPLVLFPALVTESSILLSWSVSPNRTYQLEFSSRLESENWQAVPGEISVAGGRASMSDMLTPTNRFYRVRMLP